MRRVNGRREQRASGRRSRNGRAVLLALSTLACTAFAACGPGPDPTADVKLSCTIAPLPPHVGPAAADITLQEKGKPLTGATLRVKSSVSRGTTSNTATVHESGNGQYR